MTVEYNDYQDLLLTYNYSDSAGQTLLDDTSTTSDDDHVKVEVIDGKYQFNYFLLTSVADMASLGYYDVPGNDINGSGYDSYYNYLAEDGSGNKDPSLTSNQIQIIQNVLHSSSGDGYSVSFEDVADVKFTTGTTSDAHITFGQLDSTHPGIQTPTGPAFAGTVVHTPNNNVFTEEHNGDIWLNEDSFIWSDTQEGNLAYATIIHEVMHSLGVDVFADSNNIGTDIDNMKHTITSYNLINDSMNPSGVGNEVLAAGLQLLDIAAIQEIYGANYDTRSEDNTT